MLVLSRRVNESVLVGDNLVFTILGIRGDNVRIGIRAPQSLRIQRQEIAEALERESAERRLASVRTSKVVGAEATGGRTTNIGYGLVQEGIEEAATSTVRRLVEPVGSTETTPPNSMVIVTRKRRESIVVGSDVVFTVVDVRVDKVRIGVQAPKDFNIQRQEIVEAIEWEAAQRRVSVVSVGASELIDATAAEGHSTSFENAEVTKRAEDVASDTVRGFAETVRSTEPTQGQPAAPEWPRFCAELRELSQRNPAEWAGIDALQIALYLTGKCSPEEVDVIQNGISRSSSVRDWIELARKILLADDIVEEELSIAVKAMERLTPEKQDQVYRHLVRELDDYSSQLQATWGDIDESLIERYLDNDCSDAERTRVEQAMRDFPAVRECVELSQHAAAEFFSPENPD